MDFELDLEGETRCDEKLRARIRGRSWKGADSREMKAAGQRRMQRKIGKVSQGVFWKAPNPRPRSQTQSCLWSWQREITAS